METDYDNYKKDPRIPCKYGEKCYQRNSGHLNQYKHPPKKNKRKPNLKPEPGKRPKLDSSVKNENEATNWTKNDTESTTKECISSSGSESDTDGNSKEEFTEVTPFQDDEQKSTNTEQCKLDNKGELEPNDDFAKRLDKDIQEKKEQFNPKNFIKSRFLVNLPCDFYDFWDFCKDLNSKDPTNALQGVGLKLVGPFDVLAGKFKNVKKDKDDYLRHWRYYYDPPEVLTVIKGDENTGYHIGYLYDSPDEDPSLLVSNYGTKCGDFKKLGDNIFAAVNFYLEELKRTGDPFKKIHIGKYLTKLKTKAEQLKLHLSLYTEKTKEREKKVVTKTFNKLGLVVPYNKKTQLGYRDLAIDDNELMTLLNKLEKCSPEQKSKYLSDLQPVLTYASIALDECDFGTGVKLGWELLYHGIDSLNSTISQFLSNSYRLLNKEAFAKITEIHMKNRKKGTDLSIV